SKLAIKSSLMAKIAPSTNASCTLASMSRLASHCLAFPVAWKSPQPPFLCGLEKESAALIERCIYYPSNRLLLLQLLSESALAEFLNRQASALRPCSADAATSGRVRSRDAAPSPHYPVFADLPPSWRQKRARRSEYRGCTEQAVQFVTVSGPAALASDVVDERLANEASLLGQMRTWHSLISLSDASSGANQSLLLLPRLLLAEAFNCRLRCSKFHGAKIQIGGSCSWGGACIGADVDMRVMSSERSSLHALGRCLIRSDPWVTHLLYLGDPRTSVPIWLGRHRLLLACKFDLSLQQPAAPALEACLAELCRRLPDLPVLLTTVKSLLRHGKKPLKDTSVSSFKVICLLLAHLQRLGCLPPINEDLLSNPAASISASWPADSADRLLLDFVDYLLNSGREPLSVRHRLADCSWTRTANLSAPQILHPFVPESAGPAANITRGLSAHGLAALRRCLAPARPLLRMRYDDCGGLWGLAGWLSMPKESSFQ
ncbi:hypothetical protein BOX15_Mlig026390g1, partial [Macrostomum lignano]